jgi:hypothetical protein
MSEDFGFHFEITVKDIVVSEERHKRQAIVDWRCGNKVWNDIHVERWETLTVHKDIYIWYADGNSSDYDGPQRRTVDPFVTLIRFNKDDVFFEWFQQTIKVHKGDTVQFWVPLLFKVDIERVTHATTH